MPDYKVCVWSREICSIFVVKEEKQYEKMKKDLLDCLGISDVVQA